jgi:hypothetical protein
MIGDMQVFDQVFAVTPQYEQNPVMWSNSWRGDSRPPSWPFKNIPSPGWRCRIRAERAEREKHSAALIPQAVRFRAAGTGRRWGLDVKGSSTTSLAIAIATRLRISFLLSFDSSALRRVGCSSPEATTSRPPQPAHVGEGSCEPTRALSWGRFESATCVLLHLCAICVLRPYERRTPPLEAQFRGLVIWWPRPRVCGGAIWCKNHRSVGERFRGFSHFWVRILVLAGERKEHLSWRTEKSFVEDPKEQEVKNVSISGVRVSFLRVWIVEESSAWEGRRKVVEGCFDVISKVGIIGAPAPSQPCKFFLIWLSVVGPLFH